MQGMYCLKWRNLSRVTGFWGIQFESNKPVRRRGTGRPLISVGENEVRKRAIVLSIIRRSVVSLEGSLRSCTNSWSCQPYCRQSPYGNRARRANKRFSRARLIKFVPCPAHSKTAAVPAVASASGCLKQPCPLGWNWNLLESLEWPQKRPPSSGPNQFSFGFDLFVWAPTVSLRG